MLPMVPLFLLPAASGCNILLEKLSPKKRAVAYGACLVALASFLPFAYPFSHTSFEPTRREYLELIRKNLAQGSLLISDFEGALFTHEVGKEKKITFMAISPQVVYADRQLYLRGETLPPPLGAATGKTEKIKEWINGKGPVYLVLYDVAGHQAAIKNLTQNFDLKPIAQSKHFKIVQLQNPLLKTAPIE